MEDMTTAALQYAELKGWPVFPVSKDKRPLVAKDSTAPAVTPA